MKKILFFSTALFTGLVSSQVIQEDNFNSYTIGNLGTQGGWERDQGAAAQVKIAEITPSTYGKSLNFARTTTANMWVTKSPATFVSGWAARTAGNDIVKVSYDHYTGTGSGTTEAQLYTSTYVTLASVRFAGGNWYVKADNGSTVSKVGTGAASTWNQITIAYNSVSGSVTYTINGTEYGPYTTSIGVPGEVDFFSGSAILNSAIDNYKVEAIAPVSYDNVPNCTTMITPTQGSVVNAGSAAITWNAAPTASSYKLTIGTTPGGSDVYNGSVYVTSANVSLQKNTTYYAKVVPTNNVGDAVGCTEISFATNNEFNYCTGSGTVDTNTGLAILEVDFADMVNSSTRTAYTDFTTTVAPANVKKEASYTLGITNGQLGDPYIMYTGDVAYAWIDYNQDGIFDNTTERTEIIVGDDMSIRSTASITIPSTALVGVTRMRVRYSNSQGANSNTACGTGFGEVEDYLVNIQPAPTAAVSDINKSNVSVYPNPFKDVLRISDVKDATSVIVSDLSGRTVADMKPATELNLSTLNKGVYIVTIKYANGEVKSTKVIKE